MTTIRSIVFARTLLFCLITLCSACTQPVPRIARLAPDAVILAFGDSLTFGTGANTPESYPAVLAGLTGRRVINAGIPGELSAEGAQRLDALLDREHPQLLILCHGGNDLLRRLDPQQTNAQLRHMIEAARQRGIAVVLIGVPEPKLFNRHSAPYYATLAEEFRLPLEAETLARIEGDNALKSDGVHPNAQGYRQLAQAVYALLHQTGAV
jgi:acyl-CoA thioesterase I